MGTTEYQAKYPVQTLEKSLDVLLYVKNNGSRNGVSIAEISEAMEMPKSGVHRILDTFLEYDFIEKNPQTQTYQLGWGLYFAGNGIPLQYSISTIDYMPAMQALCDKLQETVNIGILKGSEVIIICTIEPNRRLRPTVEVGEREPIHATALGKIFMSSWRDAEITERMKQAHPQKLTEHTILTAKEMVAEVQRVRERGFAIDHEEFCEGLTCLAMPIFDHSGKTVAAISVSGVSSRITPERIDEVVAELQTVSKKLSGMLGYK